MAVGDALDPGAAQDQRSDRGKILRLASPIGLGGDAADVYASGIRNSYGMAFDPKSGDLWETENGPTCNDEINSVRPGGNYGWGPTGNCDDRPSPRSTNADGEDPILPLLTFTPPIAPTGIAFCEGCGLGSANEGALFFADYNNGDIHRVTLDSSREHIVNERVVAETPDLALSMEVGPDQALYVSSYISIFRLVVRGRIGASMSGSPDGSSSTARSPSRTGGANATTGGGLSVALGVLLAIGLGVVVVASFILRRG
jgi:glucose/arabinose dehydrogenase